MENNALYAVEEGTVNFTLAAPVPGDSDLFRIIAFGRIRCVGETLLSVWLGIDHFTEIQNFF